MALTKQQREILIEVKKAYDSFDVTTTAEIEATLDIAPEIDFDEWDIENPPKNTQIILKHIKQQFVEDDSTEEKLRDLLIPTLPQELSDIVSKIGDRPSEEEELYKANHDEIKNIIENRFDADLSKYDDNTLLLFYAKIQFKITSPYEDKGVLKHIPQMNEIGFVNKELTEEIQKHLEKKEPLKAVKKAIKKVYNFDVSEWEMELLVRYVMEQMEKKSKTLNSVFRKAR